MARTRRNYTPEFKVEAVSVVTEQGFSFAEAARSLGLNENLIRSWKQALGSQGAAAGFFLSARAEALPLRGRKLAASGPRINGFGGSCDILKKATALFAREAI